MAETFFSLPRKDQADALGVAANSSGRLAHLLEKDVWVVWPDVDAGDLERIERLSVPAGR